jgi:hypothetical protein
VKKERWICLLLILVAFAAGILVGMRRPNTMAMMVTQQGKVYPAPRDGDVVNWIGQDGLSKPVTWDFPPHSPFKSPCKSDTPSDQCKVKFKTKTVNTMYHYKCSGCGDPTGPGPHATGSSSFGASATQTVTTAPGGTIYSAIADLTLQNVSGVWYFTPDAGTSSGFIPIPVATYPAGSNMYDQIVWETPLNNTGNALPWNVAFLPQTCQEQTTGNHVIGSTGSSTCTVLPGAVSQNYCVVYNGNTVGPAVLLVNDPNPQQPTLPTNPLPSCTL